MKNTVVQIGRLVRDPDFRKTTTGKSMCKFTMAMDREYKQEGQQDADFVTFVAFNQNADYIGTYAKKGYLVGVRGSLQSGSYERDGQKIYTLEVKCDSVSILERKQPQNTATNQAQASEKPKDDISITDDELPF